MTTSVQDHNRTDQPAPTVSVQIAVYNGARFLAATLDSLLNQHWRDFELIIVDDGSTDATPQILAEYTERDSRIMLLRNQTQQGISAARNRALAVARGRYVAISDADDLSYPQRLQNQVAFLDAHPAVGVVGTCADRIDENGMAIGKILHPADSALLQWRLLFAPCIVHSSSMIRRALLVQTGGYDVTKPYTIDYDLWLRLTKLTKFYTLQEELVAYRTHHYGVTGQHKTAQYTIALQLTKAAITEQLGRVITLAEARGLRALATGGFIHATGRELHHATFLLRQLYGTYQQQIALTPPEKVQLADDLTLYFRRLAAYQRKHGAWWKYLYSRWQEQRMRWG